MEKIRIENGLGIIPKGTTRIGQVRGLYGIFLGDTSFKGKEELKKVIITSSVTTIG